jgi:hypothetical protein
MNTLRSEAAPCNIILHVVPTLAREPESAWAAEALREDAPPASLAEARAHRDDLTRLLRREHETAADFLLALADFDRRRGWEPLGHASLFAFLTRELGLSKGGAFFRLTAARLVRRFPEVLGPLRDGRLCITSVVELSRVVTHANLTEVLPRFYGCSSREAREVAAALAPRQDPPRREVVTALPAVLPITLPPPIPAAPAQVQSTEPPLRRAAPPPRAEVEPLTADLRRLHLTVSARLLEKVAAARVGLSHALPGATTEQVLEAALDLLLEQQARSKALVKRPRAARQAQAQAETVAPSSAAATPGEPQIGADLGARHVPAAIEREVRLRDGGRCQFPLDAGGICGSTWQVELDHLVPLALGGPSTAANLRCACRVHNRYAAEQALGLVLARPQARRRRRPAPGGYSSKSDAPRRW